MIPATIHIGYVHPGVVHEQFMVSVTQAFKYSDRIIGMTGSKSARQFVARNDIIREFLEGEAEWFIQIDTDMTFGMTAIDDLVRNAVAADARVAAGLCFIYDPNENKVLPNIFMWDEDKKDYDMEIDYEEDSQFWCDATGSAFLLLHRTILEELGEPWHQNWVSHPDTGKPMGHDISLCHRIRTETGEPILYCADIKIGHIKNFVVDEDTYKAYRRATG